MKHVVMFSSGIGSWATAMRVKERYLQPGDELVLLFADVGGRHESEFDGEDADCYRFLNESATQLGGDLVTLNQGLNIWEIFRKDRFLGNARLANCSKFLKRIPCRKWLEANTTPEDTMVYVGIDWSETHRLPAIREGYEPWSALAPMTEKPYLDKRAMLAWCREVGVEPPAMYAKGFPHANCGGGCVRAGHGQFAMLLERDPKRYAFWEAQEQGLRDYLGKDVSILRDRSDDSSRPMTLTEFRRNHDTGQLTLLDLDDIGGCGCFTNDD